MRNQLWKQIISFIHFRLLNVKNIYYTSYNDELRIDFVIDILLKDNNNNNEYEGNRSNDK